MMRGWILGLIMMAMLCRPPAVPAGGSGAYPNGADDFMAGLVPPPGTYLMLYSNYYSADRYKDDNGDDYDAGPLADVDVSVWANVLRLVHVTDIRILGANWAVQTLIPVLDMDFEFGAPFHGLGDSKFGLGDIIVDPLLLAWHWKHFHWAAGLDIFLPTGSYDMYREPTSACLKPRSGTARRASPPGFASFMRFSAKRPEGHAVAFHACSTPPGGGAVSSSSFLTISRFFSTSSTPAAVMANMPVSVRATHPFSLRYQM